MNYPARLCSTMIRGRWPFTHDRKMRFMQMLHMSNTLPCLSKSVQRIIIIHWDFFTSYSKSMKILDNQLQGLGVY